eukprot:gene1790-932_t
MELLTLNCKGTKIQVDKNIISISPMLSAYWEKAKQNKMLETKNDEYFLNCTGDTMNKLLDLLLCEKMSTTDELLLGLSQFLCIDIDFINLEKIHQEEEKKQKKSFKMKKLNEK